MPTTLNIELCHSCDSYLHLQTILLVVSKLRFVTVNPGRNQFTKLLRADYLFTKCIYKIAVRLIRNDKV
jgi:hypothetical protein